ncbi:MAG: NlpC/P60 family protein [Micromonosporaceae bacterium]
MTDQPAAITRGPRTPGRFFALLVTLGVTLGLAATATPAAADPSIQELEAKIEKLAAQLGPVIEKYNQARDKLDETKAKAARLAKSMKPLQDKADKMYAEVGKIAKQAYKGGRASAVNALLGSGSPETLVDQLSTLDRLAAGQQKGLHGLELITSRLNRQKGAIDSLLADRREIEHDLAARKKKIQGQIDKLQELRRKAYGEKYGNNKPSYIPPYIPGPAGKAVRYAIAQIGDPYSFGSDGPDSFDCSGLVLASWREAGVSLPHSSKKQYYATRRVSRDELAPGDIVFYYSDIHHDAVYVGDGWIVHAPEPGRYVEQVRYDKWEIYGYGRPG